MCPCLVGVGCGFASLLGVTVSKAGGSEWCEPLVFMSIKTMNANESDDGRLQGVSHCHKMHPLFDVFCFTKHLGSTWQRHGSGLDLNMRLGYG